MLENFLKKSSWTDIVVSLIFVLFGAMLVMNPEMVQAMIAILLGAVFIAMGVFRLINYFASGKMDNYSLATGIVAMIVGIVIMFCSGIILSIFRIIIAIWIIYSGIINLQTTIIWKDFKSRLWLLSLILSILMIIAGIFILANNGAILQTIGVMIIAYAIINIIENIIFMKKIENYGDQYKREIKKKEKTMERDSINKLNDLIDRIPVTDDNREEIKEIK